MNKLLRQFEKESGLEIYGLGARREKWEHCIEKFTELIVRECGEVAYKAYWDNPETVKGIHIQEKIKEHFGVKESKGWICPKCNADRTKIACPLGFGATVDGRCPMTVEAQ